MFSTVFSAFYQAFLPILAVSSILSYWFLVKHPHDPKTTTTAFKAQLKTLKVREKHRAKDKNHRSELNIVQRKWMQFGGNFYGIVALYTYIVVEFADIVSFIRTFTGIADFIDRIGLGMVIDMLIQALMNFITAITWPLYWLSHSDAKSAVFIWLIMAYVGYLLGIKAAMAYINYTRRP